MVTHYTLDGDKLFRFQVFEGTDNIPRLVWGTDLADAYVEALRNGMTPTGIVPCSA